MSHFHRLYYYSRALPVRQGRGEQNGSSDCRCAVPGWFLAAGATGCGQVSGKSEHEHDWIIHLASPGTTSRPLQSFPSEGRACRVRGAPGDCPFRCGGHEKYVPPRCWSWWSFQEISHLDTNPDAGVARVIALEKNLAGWSCQHPFNR